LGHFTDLQSTKATQLSRIELRLRLPDGVGVTDKDPISVVTANSALLPSVLPE
jgi:hypothetical protein